MVAEVPNDVIDSTRQLSMYYRQTPRTIQPGNYQSGRGEATGRPCSHLAVDSSGGEPSRGYQSPPQSSDKPLDSAERYEWLSAAMRRAGRLAMRLQRMSHGLPDQTESATMIYKCM